MPEYEINITDYIRTFRKRKFIIIIITIFTTIASAAYISMQPPIYQASTTVKVLERGSVAGILTEWIVYSPADIMESEAKIITGFPIMKKVAERLGMINEEMTDAQILNIVGSLQGGVGTQTVKNTNIIRITASSGNPRKAMDIANTVARVYVDENLLEKKRQASSTREFIEEQLGSLEDRLKKTEEKLGEYTKDAKDVRLAEPIQGKIIELQFKLATLKQMYTDKHPEVIELNEQIENLKTQLRGFSDEELEFQRLYREVEVDKKLYDMLKGKLEEARITEAQKVGDISIVDPAAMPTAPISPKKRLAVLFGLMLGLLLGFIMVFIVENLDTSISTIEDMERISKLPVLGILPLVEYKGAAEKNIFRRILYSLPFFKPLPSDEENIYIRLTVYNEPKSPTSEAYRNIRTNLKLGPSLKSILVTSAAPREGKTTVTINLGMAIALSGEKTIIVSSDLRRPAIAATFGLEKEPGLNEVITKSKNLDESIRGVSDMILGGVKLDKMLKTPDIENLYLLPSGKVPDNPAELLESHEIRGIIDELRRRFDVIIFDSPPVLPITDASLLVPYIDGVVLVYEAGRTPRSALLRAKVQLESAGARVLGVVLNHIKQDIEYTSTYPYYYRYRYYSGEKKRKKIDEKTPKEDKGPPK